MVACLSFYLYGNVKRLMEKKLESSMSPVTAEIYLVPPPRSLSAGIVTPRNNSLSNMASVIAIEEVTPSPKKKKKNRSANSDSDGDAAAAAAVGGGSRSVAAVLPFATHVSDHIPVAELEEEV